MFPANEEDRCRIFEEIKQFVKTKCEPLWSLLSLYNHYGRQIDSLVKKESGIGYLELAINCLKDRLIYTKAPEEIFGGGLLKYANVLQGWVPMRLMRTPMVKKFLGDYFKMDVSFDVISKYMDTHYAVIWKRGWSSWQNWRRMMAIVERHSESSNMIRQRPAITSKESEPITERARRFAK